MGFLFLSIGILARMFIPYLVKLWKNNRKEEPEKMNWEWKYLRGQLIAVVIVGVALPLLVKDLSSVAEMNQQLAWLSGYAIADIGRFVDATVTE